MEVQWMLSQAEPATDDQMTHMDQMQDLWRGNGAFQHRQQSSCQVPGCTADLSSEKVYSQKKRVCSYHMSAEVVARPDGELCRFCFQCGKLEPVAAFDGTKMSCRARLQRRKLPVRRSQTWTAGSRGGLTSSSSSSAALQQQQAAQAQQLALLVKLQEQRLELDAQHQQMLLLQQQQQQQQHHHHHMRIALQNPGPSLSLASSSASPEALALLQQQQMLVEQAQLHIQALRAAGVSAYGNMAHNTVPLEMVSVAGFDGLSPRHTGPLVSLAGLSNGSLTAPAAGASNGMHQAAQLQDGAFAGATAPTAAAAAAALAGSSGWPFIGSAAAAGPAGLGMGLAENRSKSTGPLLLDSGNSLDAGVEGVDEVDPLATDDTFQTVADVLNEEFAAALPGLDLMSGGHDNTYMSHFGDEHILQGQQQQQQLGSGTVPGARAHEVPACLPAQAQLQHGGFLQAANSSAGTVSFGGVAPVAAVQQVQLLQQMQLGERELHQQQLEQLMQTVQFLQTRVKELSLHLGGPAPAGMPAPTAGSFGGM